MKPSPAVRRRSLALVALALSVAALPIACGPVGIGVALSAGGGGGGSTAPLDLESVELPPGVEAGPCGLIRRLSLRVNRPGVTLRYTRNGGPEQPFTDPVSGAPEPELVPGVATERRLLVRAGDNTVVVRASVGAETVQKTIRIDVAVDPVVVDLEPPDVRGQNMRLSWSLPTGSQSFFWVFFGDTAGAIDTLAGTADEGTSPLRVPVTDLGATTVGGRTRYSFQLTSLPNAANGLLRYHYLAVRSNDGCESRVVAAHTRPAAQLLQWPAAARIALALATPAGTPAAPPVGGAASSVDVVGMPPTLVDRGVDASTSLVSPPDGALDVAIVDRTGKIFVSRNDLGGLAAPVAVDDTASTQFVCPSVPSGPTGDPIRAFAFDNDDDQRPDFFALTAERLWVYFGDDVGETSTPFPTPGIDRFLNWKKDCDSYIELADVPGLPAGHRFLDAWHADFDGDGVEDLVTSLGVPQTATTDGATFRIVVWYQDRDPGGFALWNWPDGDRTDIAVGTGFGDDGYFVTGDVDGDGRCDLLTMRHLTASTATYRVWLMHGRNAPPELVESGLVDPRNEAVRWDQSALVDLDHDGTLDVLGLRSVFVGAGTIVRLTGYRTDLGGDAIDTGSPLLSRDLERTHQTTFPVAPRQRGHLQVRDVDGDGTAEVLLRNVTSGSEYMASRVAVYRGLRDPVTGLQNWQGLNAASTQVDFQLPLGDVPHVHFAVGDLDGDGVDDFTAVHERPTTPHEAVVMSSNTAWQWERFVASPSADRYRFGGSLRTGGGATLAQPGRVDRDGDLIVRVRRAEGVTVLPAASDGGVANGAFGVALTKPLQAPLPADVVQVVVPAVPGVQNDPIVLLADGTIGTLLYDSVAGSYAFRAETTAVGATAIHVGSFDADRRADLIAVDGSATLRLFATVDATGAHGGDLAERGTLTLPRAPELVLVDNTVLDRFSEVVVVLSPAPGSDARVVQTYPVSRANGTGAASFVGGASSATTFPTRLVSLAAGNFTGRHRNNLDRRKWLVGGTADGRVLTARNGEAQAIELPPGLGAIGSGAIEVVVADFSNDYLPDIVAYERGSKTIAVFRCKPDASEAWRFPNPGAYEFQGAGEFDSPAVVTIPEPLSALTAARVDNDPYHDLLLLSADGERVHVVLTRGSQIGN